MKIPLTLISLGLLAFLPSCAPTATRGSVEGLERQAPVTPDQNAVGDALNARNAVDYANDRNRGYHGGYGYRGGYPYGY